MSYNQYVDLDCYKFGYLLDRIVYSRRCDGVVEIGNEKFSAILYEDGTYPYRLEGKEYYIYIDPISPVDDSKFIVMKTWFRDQDKYHGSEIWD